MSAITDHEFVLKDGDESSLFARCWHVIPHLGGNIKTVVCGKPLNEHAYLPRAGFEQLVSETAAKYGPDAAIEAAAQSLDITAEMWLGWPTGLGDVLRDGYATLKPYLLVVPAASSGAEHELDYYGGAA